jgi:uncharacterized membrane protein YccC
MIERALGIVLVGVSTWWLLRSVRALRLERHARRVAR